MCHFAFLRRVVLLGLVSSTVNAQVPLMMTYQGRLLKPDGSPEAGPVSMTFTLYDAPTGGLPVSCDAAEVILTDGYYSLGLGGLGGCSTGLPAISLAQFDGSDRYLEVSAKESTLAPRQRVGTVPYAAYAGTAAGLTGSLHVVGAAASAGRGYVACGPASTLVSGEDTHFLTDLTPGATLTVGSESRIVVAISSDTSLTVDRAFSTSTDHKTYSFQKPPALMSSSTGTALFSVNGQGNVGIGTASPSSLLTVQRDQDSLTYFDLFNQSAGSNAGALMRLITSSGSTDFVRYRNGLSVINVYGTDGELSFKTGGSEMRMDKHGNIGVGTAAPATMLDVKAPGGWSAWNIQKGLLASFDPSRPSNPAIGMMDVSQSKPVAIVNGDGNFEFFAMPSLDNSTTAPTPLMSITRDAKVGIGTTDPQANLHVVGSAGNSTGVWSALSDRRLKKEIEPIHSALSTVTKLEGRSFRWLDPAKDAQYGRVRGMVAQEVEQVIPEWVKSDSDGLKRLEPIGVDALLIEAIKELKKENDRLSQTNGVLAERISHIEAQLGNRHTPPKPALGATEPFPR